MERWRERAGFEIKRERESEGRDEFERESGEKTPVYESEKQYKAVSVNLRSVLVAKYLFFPSVGAYA